MKYVNASLEEDDDDDDDFVPEMAKKKSYTILHKVNYPKRVPNTHLRRKIGIKRYTILRPGLLLASTTALKTKNRTWGCIDYCVVYI